MVKGKEVASMVMTIFYPWDPQQEVPDEKLNNYRLLKLITDLI
jgi:hypothetical protein